MEKNVRGKARGMRGIAMYDITALGESLIDFTPSGVNDMGIQLYGCNPGGAPANFLAMNAKLGGRVAFIGKVGDDAFGSFLEKTMVEGGIDVKGLRKSKEVPTTLAFVQLSDTGDRTFSFYRKPGADIMLTREEVDTGIVENTRVFHFGTLSMTDEPSRSATFYAVDLAKKAGALISYDPNYRPALWDSPEDAMAMMQKGVPLADIIKVSDEEMTLMTGETGAEAGARKLLDQGAALVLVTGGEKGAFYMNHVCCGALPAYDVKVVDTTGSGDAFLGALMYRLKGLDRDAIAHLPEGTLRDAVLFGNAAGGLTATARGAIPAMPDEAGILACMREMPLHKATLA